MCVNLRVRRLVRSPFRSEKGFGFTTRPSYRRSIPRTDRTKVCGRELVRSPSRFEGISLLYSWDNGFQPRLGIYKDHDWILYDPFPPDLRRRGNRGTQRTFFGTRSSRPGKETTHENFKVESKCLPVQEI